VESAEGLPVWPLFSATQPEDTACTKGVSWNASDLHYTSIDLQEQGISQCGALAFVNESGRWKGYYDFSGTHPGEWSTWRKLTRTTSSSTLTDSVAQHGQIEADSVDIPFKLEPQYDLLGLHHHIVPNSQMPPPGVGVEAWAQIWRAIDEPVIDSVRASHDTVTVVFRNRSWQRSIDSTWVERRRDGGIWSRIGSLGAAANQFIDTLVSPGNYTYRLKHVSEPVLRGFKPAPSPPNSGWVDTAVTVPGFDPPQGFYCDDDLIPAVTCAWRNTTDTATIELERNGLVRDTAAAGSTSWTDPSVSWDSTYRYRARYLSLAHNTVSDWTNEWTITVEPTAPQGLRCASSQGTVSCGWSPGEVNDTTEVWRQPEESYWSLLTKLQPGKSQVFDYDVTVGLTYCYKVRHRRNAVITGFSNVSCTAVQGGGPGPLPGRPGKQ
jgi:hypothetical protein